MNNSFETNLATYQENDFKSNCDTELVTEAVELLRRLGIKLVAFDFDYTLVNIHTGGQWPDSAEKLAEFVRPCFRHLLPELLRCHDIHTCVVTFSPQEQLIRQVLKISLKDIPNVETLIDKIVIKGNSKEFLNEHGYEAYTNGKQLHLDFCRNYLNQSGYSNIENKNILLIDDDETNLKVAEKYEHYVFQVDNGVNLDLLVNFLRNYPKSNTY